MAIDTTTATPSGLDVYPPVPNGGAVAPANQTYVTVSNESATLPNSRQITAGTNISIVDGGAGGPITINSTASGGDTITAVAVENIAAGQFVAVYDASGTPKCRVAKSSSGQGFQADGFCKAAFLATATATIYLPGAVNAAGGTGLTAGDVFLGTDGYATNTAPSTVGYISQQIGVAQSATSVAFEPQPDILIASAHAVTTGGSTTSVAITSSTTININNTIGAGWLEMVAGGGGGRSSGGGTATGGGGGGAGEYCQNFMVPLVPGETVTVTIGAGGAGGTAGSNGSAGGTTSFACTAGTFSVLGGSGAASTNNSGAGGGPRGAAVVTATGGAGSLGTAESPCHFGGSAGGAGNTSGNNGGGGGGAPGYLVGGGSGIGNGSGGGGGGGGGSIWGVGGAGGAGNAAGASAASTAYGAGGGGAGGNSGVSKAGGDGAPGYVLLMYVA